MKLLLSVIVTTFLLKGALFTAQDLKKRSNYFLTDTKGKQVSQNYSYLEDFDDAGYAVFAIGGNNSVGYGKIEGAKYGLIDKTGKTMIPAKYDYVDKFGYSDSLYKVQVGDFFGLVTRQDKIILPIKFKDLDYFYDLPGIVKTESENQSYQLYNLSGVALTPFYQSIDNNDHGFTVQQGGYKGLIDKQYKTLIPLKYREIEGLNDGKYLVEDMFLKKYLIEKNGTMVGTTSYDAMESVRSSEDYSKTIGYKVTLKGKRGYLDQHLKTIIPIAYKEVNTLEIGCDKYIFSTENFKDQYALFNSEGKAIGKALYEYVYYYSVFDKYLLVQPEIKEKNSKKKGKKNSEDDFDNYEYKPSVYQLIDFNGNKVLPDVIEDYTVPSSYSDEKLLLIKSKGTWTAYNEELKPVLKNPEGSTESFTYLDNIDGGYCLVQIGGKDEGYGKPSGGVFGIYNASGKQVIPMTYEDIETVGYGNDLMLKVKKNGKWGLLTLEGNKLTEILYDNIECNDGSCIVSIVNEQASTKKYGVIEASTGKVQIPVRYDFVEHEYNSNDYVVSLNNKFGLVDGLGNVILKPRFSYIKSSGLYDRKDLYLANIYGSAKESYYGNMDVEGGNWGVISRNGDTLTPLKFKEIEFKNDSILSVTDLDGFAYLMHFPSLKIMTDKEANFIDELGYSYNEDEKTYLIGKEVTKDEYGYPTGGIYGLCNVQGKKLADYKYAKIENESDFFIGTYMDFNGFDLIDKQGKLLIQNAQSIVALSDSLFFSQMDGKYTLFNTHSKKYDPLEGALGISLPEYFYGTVLIGVKTENGKWGLLNELGGWLIKPTYCDIQGTDNHFVIAATCADAGTYKYGVIDAANNVLIPFEYESIEEDYGKYKCVLGKKLYTKNLNNEILKTEEATDENIR